MPINEDELKELMKQELMKRAEPFNYSPIGDWLAGMNFIWMGVNGIVFTSPTSPEGTGHDESSVFSRCEWREVCRERNRLSQLNHENLLLDDPEVKPLDIVTDIYDGSQTYATPSNTGMKYDVGKSRLDLIPPLAEIELGNVLAFGAAKYEAESWREVSNAIQRYTAAAQRHINAMRRGELYDTESGLLHSAHAACNMMFVTELMVMHKMEDE